MVDRLERVGWVSCTGWISWINKRLTLSLRQKPVGLGCAIEITVAIHGKVPANHRGNFPNAEFVDFALNLTEIPFDAPLLHIAAIADAMDVNVT